MPLLQDDRARALWDDAAPGWNDQSALIQDWLAEPTRAMLDAAAIGPGMQVLDLAAGAGDQACDIARRIGEGSVLVTDISPVMLTLAARNFDAAGLHNARFECLDMETLALEEAGFDAAVCRLGLMFAHHPARVLHAVRTALRPGGRFGALVFSAPPGNPTLGIIMPIALRHAGQPPRDPFQPGSLMSLGKPGLLEQLFQDAGFREIRVTRIAAPIRAASVEAYLQFLQSAAAPVRDLLNGMSADIRQAALAEMAAALLPFLQDGAFQAGTELLLASGTA
ncbi:MAG: methyltransferase domain-containing protein [Rhizomicrobium sp.]